MHASVYRRCRVWLVLGLGVVIAKSPVIDIQRRTPLVDLMALPDTTGSLQHAIDNVHTLGDVGGMSELRLRKILPHASAEQLVHIETCSKERDLTPITDPLWQRHFARRFGEHKAKLLQKQTPQGDPPHIWRSLYEEKVAEEEKLQVEGVERLKDLYHRQDAAKASRKIQCTEKMAPEASRKRAKTATTLQNSARLPTPRPKQRAVEVESRGFVDTKNMAPVAESRGSVAKNEKKVSNMTPRVEKHKLWKKAIKEHHDQLRLLHATTDKPLVLPRLHRLG